LIRGNQVFFAETIAIKPLYHKNINCSGLYFPGIEELMRLVKTLPDARRSRTHSFPHIPDAAANLKALHSLLDGMAILNNKISDERKPASSVHHPACQREKDRAVPISDKMIEMLRTYYKMYRPKVWFFEGQKIGEQYSETSLKEVLIKAVTRAEIKKPVKLHWLRHSYAMHLLESGIDLRYIQELLGHKSSKTTEIYTHVTEKSLQKIKSPFDDL